MSRPFVKKRGHDGAELARLPVWSELPEGHPLDDAANKDAYTNALKVFNTARQKASNLRLLDPSDRFWTFAGVSIDVQDGETCTIEVEATSRLRSCDVLRCPGGIPGILPSLLESTAKTIKRAVCTWDRGGPSRTPAQASAICEIVAAIRMAGIRLEYPITIRIIDSRKREDHYNPATLDFAKMMRSLDFRDARIVEYSDALHTSITAADRVYSNGYTTDLAVYARQWLFPSASDSRIFDSVLMGHAITHLSLSVRCRAAGRVIEVCKHTPCLRSLRLDMITTVFPNERAVHGYEPFPVDSQSRLDELAMLRFDITGCCDDESCTSVGRVLKFICSRAPNITTFCTDLVQIPAYYITVITQWLPEIPISALYAQPSAAPLTGQCDFAKLLPNVARIGLLYDTQPETSSELLTAVYRRLRGQHRHLCAVRHIPCRGGSVRRAAGVKSAKSVHDKERLKRLVAWQQACLAVHLTCASAKCGVPVDVKQTAKMIRDLIGRTDAELTGWSDGWSRGVDDWQYL